jgi:hypothetical protein
LQKTELVDFLSQSAGESISAVEPPPAKAGQPEHTSLVKAKPRLAGRVHLRNLEMIGVESHGSPMTIGHDTTVEARLTLDLSELRVPDDTPLNYKASIYGKGWGRSSGMVVGEAEGTIIPKETVTIDVEGNTLPEGTYQLAATVILAPPGTKPTAKPGLIAAMKGGQLQVV